MSNAKCESCGMPIAGGHGASPRLHADATEAVDVTIETGPYCHHCVDEHGELQAFEERFERMVQFRAQRSPGASRQELEAQTLAYLATMPAWRDHPRVKRGS